MRAVDIIRKKRDGQALELGEIDAFVAGVAQEKWPDYQSAALLMAIVLRGMNDDETARLTTAMVRSGTQLDLSDIPGPKVDKHSTGGVGDKTSLILAPLAAACGVIVPMMSGRGLGHSGGTLDKLESIPGFRVDLSLAEFRDALRKVGCAMIGQTSEIAPADKKLYALRDVTATVESIPLITASIMSKKIAEGISGLIMDVKCGRGAFMKTREDARSLARSIVATGNRAGVRTEALITAMDAPLGRAVGNALEVAECISVLKGEGPADLTDLSVTLAAGMLVLGGVASSIQDAQTAIRNALASGRGLDKLREIIETQGGDARVVDDVSRLPTAPMQTSVLAQRAGYVADIHAELVGRATMLLGAGRNRVEDKIDPAVGVVILARRGDAVKKGDALAQVEYRHEKHVQAALDLLRAAWRIDEAPPPPSPLILETIP